MLRKYCLLSFIGMCALHTAAAQGINWKNSRNWKLYDIHSQAGARYSLDTLRYFRNTEMNSDTIQNFLNSVTAWPAEKQSMWMGLYIATCENEEGLRKIIISTYGGFFYDQATKRYYQVAPDLTSSWLDFLNDASKRINRNN